MFGKICSDTSRQLPRQAHVTGEPETTPAIIATDLLNLSDARRPENKIAIDAARIMHTGVDVSFLGRACARDSACY